MLFSAFARFLEFPGYSGITWTQDSNANQGNVLALSQCCSREDRAAASGNRRQWAEWDMFLVLQGIIATEEEQLQPATILSSRFLSKPD